MADNTLQTGADTIATDDIGGVKYQRVKVTFGADGVATDVEAVNPLPIDVIHFPASADTTDSISAAAQINRVMFNLTEVAPLQAFANVAASQTDSNIVTAVTAKKIYVLAVAVVCGGTGTNITFNSKSGGAGTAISPLFANAANGGIVLPFNQAGWFVTNTGEGLTVTTGAGSASGVLVSYAAN